jgi:sugar (pentulose or hexulose) kinase
MDKLAICPTGKTMKYLLGIDQGATQTTAVIVDERGEISAKNSAVLGLSEAKDFYEPVKGSGKDAQ